MQRSSEYGIHTPSAKYTRVVVLWHNILDEPLLTLYSLLLFILHRDLGATALQIGALITLKPVCSLFSLYWTYVWNRSRRSLITSLVWTGLVGRLPFLFFPWMHHSWPLIAAGVFFLVLHRAATPLWMETLKQSLPKEERGRIFSRGLAWGYGLGIVLAFFLGRALDLDPSLWHWLFPISALLSMVGVVMQARIKLPDRGQKLPQIEPQRGWLFSPWIESAKLLARNRPFRRFQIGFFTAGLGLMIIYPALPHYFDDVLNLSYTELAIAISICKGIGFAATADSWGRWLSRMSVYRFSSWVFVAFGFFGLGLLSAQWLPLGLYLAYLLYGCAQSGSKLIWHMSGPIFANDEDSCLFSSVNVVTVGVRGCIGPAIGTFLCLYVSPMVVIGIGLLFFFGSALMVRSWRDVPALEPAI